MHFIFVELFALESFFISDSLNIIIAINDIFICWQT